MNTNAVEGTSGTAANTASPNPSDPASMAASLIPSHPTSARGNRRQSTRASLVFDLLAPLPAPAPTPAVAPVLPPLPEPVVTPMSIMPVIDEEQSEAEVPVLPSSVATTTNAVPMTVNTNLPFSSAASVADKLLHKEVRPFIYFLSYAFTIMIVVEFYTKSICGHAFRKERIVGLTVVVKR